MSPESSSASPSVTQMPDAETIETVEAEEIEETESTILTLKDNVEQVELNNNVSVPSPINTTVMLPHQQTVKKSSETEEECRERSASGSLGSLGNSADSANLGNSMNSTFTKTYSDSFIEKIFTEQKIEDPVARIDESRIFNVHDDLSDASESVSSKEDDDSEGVEKKDASKKLKKGRKIRDEEEMIKERLARQVRSLSEPGGQQSTKDGGDVMVFPNLQDDALQALGLLPSNDESTKERLTEEEMEVKFQTLALVFSIDAVTVGARVERLRRQRDQAEDNLDVEVARLTAAVHRLHPLCVDAETTELVTSLLDRLQFIVQASHRILTSAEMYGCVQQEWRVAESVNLMLSHLRNVIKQRDAARRQLQITKRVLQETTSPTSVLKKPGTTTTTTTTRRLTINTLPLNGRVMVAPARRASIAVIPRPLDSPSATMSSAGPSPLTAVRRVSVRRTSEAVSNERPEPSCKPWDYRRAPEWTQQRAPLLSRPSRLDINPELTKIQEGSTESFTSTSNMNDSFDGDNSSSDSSGDEFLLATATSTSTATAMATTTTMLTLQHPLIVDEYKRRAKRLCRQYLRSVGRLVRGHVERLAADGTLHEICFIGATVCFALATLFLWNIIIEIEFARNGGGHHRVPWSYVTWDEVYSFFYTVETVNNNNNNNQQ